MEGITKKLPMIALRGLTVLPEMVIHFDVSRQQSIHAVQEAMQGEEQEIFLVTQRELQIEQPKQKDVVAEEAVLLPVAEEAVAAEEAVLLPVAVAAAHL